MVFCLAGCAADPIGAGAATGADAPTLATSPVAATPATPADSIATAPVAPASFGGLQASILPQDQNLDLFGVPGHRFWLEVSDAQLELLNARQGSNTLGLLVPGFDGDIYTPTDPKAPTFADHVLVRDAMTGSVADYGQMELALVGQSTSRAWNLGAIPNVRLDTDEFEKGKRIGTFEHLRLNNALIGSIFREAITQRVYRELGYPALRASYAMLGSNVWGDDIWVPMTLVEVYKRRFCEDNAAALGGTCTNMWEFVGDVGSDGPEGLVGPNGGLPENICQVHECDNTRLLELRRKLRNTPRAAGFAAATADFIDWDRFHQFQCLSWIMATGDDAIHNGNNNLVIERDDRKLVWAPYSVDISAGQADYRVVPLVGTTTLPVGCQSDPACWSATLSTCEALIDRFDRLDPERFVDESVAALTSLGMMREGDEERAKTLRAWLVERQTNLRPELDRFRTLPDLTGKCPAGFMLCGDRGCGTPQACESRKCPAGLNFCEALQQCAFPGGGCPTCDDAAAAFYCAPVLACVASSDACSASACAGQAGTAYCAALQSCAPSADCELLGSAGAGGPGVMWPTPRM